MANNKKRAGNTNNNKIKTSKFLPSVFQTSLNTKWLDSTLDQMVSKGSLADLNGYVGTQNGRYSRGNDTYLDNNDYGPALTTTHKDGSLNHVLSFKDIKNKINSEFENYNFGSAYASNSYFFRPPVDIDKFVNFNNYHWVPELPTYKSKNTTGNSSFNPVANANGRLNYTFNDGANSFELENNLIIEFAGTEWPTTIKNKTYIVTGVGSNINMRLWEDETGKQVYNFYSQASIRTSDFFDRSPVTTVSPPEGVITSVHPETLLEDYQNNPSTPIFSEWDFTDEESNSTRFVAGKLIQFSEAWNFNTANQSSKIYLTEIDENFIPRVQLIIDSTIVNGKVETFIKPNLPEKYKEYVDLLYGFDSEEYDSSVSDIIQKDYIVIDKNCVYQTAWSRTNFWVNAQTIRNLRQLDGMYFNIDSYINLDNVARRPILEFIGSMHLYNHVTTKNNNLDEHRHIDFILPIDTPTSMVDGELKLSNPESPIPEGSTLVFNVLKDSHVSLKKLFKVSDEDGHLTILKDLEKDDYVNPKNAMNMYNYTDADLVYNGEVWTIGQQKKQVNQAPLFQIYNHEGIKLQDLPNTVFKGSRVFGYQEGSGTADLELGFAVSYTDSPKGAEFTFKNYLLTEVYESVYRSKFNRNVSNRRILNDLLYFKVDNDLRFNYTKSKIPHSLKNKNTFVFDGNDIVTKFGHNNWRATREYFLHEYYDRPVVSEVVSPGVITDKSQSDTMHMIASTEQSIIIHNLIKNNTIKFTTQDGTNIETTPLAGVTVIRTGNKIELSFDNTTDGLQLYITYSRYENTPYIIVSEYADKVYYEVTVNGKIADESIYTVGPDSITVSKDTLEKDDVIDIEYISNKPEDVNGIPQIMEFNSNNRMVETFTFSDTLDHWQSMLRHIPDLQGDIFGTNNYSASSKQLGNGGGTIFIHEDLSNTHDITFAENALNITGALTEQGRDWDSFRTRFTNQVRRLYSTKAYRSTTELTNEAIDLITVNRKGSPLYKNSNMLFSSNEKTQRFDLDSNVDDYYMTYIENKDFLISDHVYVYLTDDMYEQGKFVKRLLTKGIDYTIVGNHIKLNTTIVYRENLDPFIEVVYNDMDSNSYVPASPVKLFLKQGHLPSASYNKIIGHDGYEYNIAGDAELFDISSKDFDPVASCLLELEKRVYSGLATSNDYKSAYNYIPAPNRSTWYTVQIIDNYLEKSFARWYNKSGYASLTPDNYYDSEDAKTWNYSSILDGLPGHWKGAYIHLFGTATPHTTPWHMLGHSFKPTWWDSKFNWINPTKRTALLEALRFGYVEENVTDINFARYNWDWDNNCPVDNNGNLTDQNLVLDPDSILVGLAKAQEFVFGDWGPVESQWRNSSTGYMCMVDAIVKLSPAKAWTDMLQPGTTKTYDYKNAKLNDRTKLFISPAEYRIPGEVYGKTVTGINYENTFNSFKVSDTFAKFIGIEDTHIIDTNISYKQKDGFTVEGEPYKFISSISLNNRADGFKDQPTIISNMPDNTINETKLELILKEVPYVSNGVLQSMHNYILRNQFDVDLHQVYTSLDTQLSYKLGGFSNKNLLDFTTDSSLVGPVRLSENDFNITMYKGLADVIYSASEIQITKVGVNYKVSGISNNRQEFLFYEPNLSNINKSTVLSFKNLNFTKYELFASNLSVVEFGSLFGKIQDTYNFIQGYFEYLRVAGYVTNTNGDSASMEFIKWSTTAEENETLIIDLGNEITFNPNFGNVQQYNTYGYHNNDILDQNGNIIENKDISVNRQDSSVTIKTKQQGTIGGISSVVINNEHVVVFDNKTTLGINMYNGVKGNYQRRLFLNGQKTSDWTGKIKSIGYLVQDNGIVQNFDSSVEQVNDYYRTDVNEFNDQITKAKDITIGNINRDWISQLGLDNTTITNFYQGALKDAGTKGAIDKIGRTTLLNHGNTNVSVQEQFMFRHSNMGDNSKLDSAEVVLDSTDITTNPQVITFETTTSKDVISIPVGSNKLVSSSLPSFETIDFGDSNIELLTAGEVLDTEADYAIQNLSEIKEVYTDSKQDISIPSWDSTTSYKLGTKVRHNGSLYQCNVESTGLSVSTSGVTRFGTLTNPTFAPGTQAVIAGVSIPIVTEQTIYDDLFATGAISNPTIQPGTELLIDGATVAFNNTAPVDVVIGPGTKIGTRFSPVLNDVTGKTIKINDTLVNFDDTPNDTQQSYTTTNQGITPGNIVETETGVAAQQTYLISQALSSETYSVATVTIDGTSVAEANFTVSGQNLTLTQPIVGGENIEITLVHTTVIDVPNTFTVNVKNITTPTIYFVKQVFVGNSETTNYTVSGQDVTINDALPVGVIVQIVVSQTPNSKNTNEIIAIINSALAADGVTTITAASTSDEKILFTLSDPTNTSATLTLDPSPTNNDLGFDALGFNIIQIVETQTLPATLDLDQAVSIINQTNLPGISASNSNNQLLLTSSLTTMAIGGSAQSSFGLNNTYTANNTVIQINTTVSSAVAQIQQKLIEAGVTDVFVTAGDTRVKVSTPLSSLDLGDTNFNTQAGLVTGIHTNTTESIQNTFNLSNWNNISHQDPALFNIWVSDDSAYEISSIGNVITKYNGWNVLQSQNQNHMFTESVDTINSGIRAGNETEDGNDAEVTTNVSHNLNVGDFVLVLNSTTVPNIDGIHKVTKIDPADTRLFYIDMFIEQDGDAASVMPLRSVRFENIDQRNAALVSPNWNIASQKLVWVNDINGTRATNVFKATHTASGENYTTGNWKTGIVADDNFSIVRQQITRVTNNDIKNALVYNVNNNNIYSELELFDPIRGIIPGAADKELDFKTAFDPAVYNNSSDESYTANDSGSWADNLVGKRWWDISKAKYYDYDQGYRNNSFDYSYVSSTWGKLFPGSEIVVWEWTKSNVAPDDYADAVTSKVTMFNTLATGEAFSIFNSNTNEIYYYYTQDKEWDNGVGQYKDVYYFWVKNKETISSQDKTLTCNAVESIIADPTGNKIGWVAAINNNTVLVGNATGFTDQGNTVLQINKQSDLPSHDSWMLIAEDKDIIPDYWYYGLRNNYSRVDSNYEILPSAALHPLNTIGDDRKIKQVWFSNVGLARRNGVSIINDLFKNVNVYEDYLSAWEYVRNDMDRPEQFRVPFADNIWKWADYYDEDLYYPELRHTFTISTSNNLDDIDTTVHEYVKVELIDTDQINRSEYYIFNNGYWKLARKENSTIEFDADKLSDYVGWDTKNYDSISWDNTKITDYWITIVEGLRLYLFTGHHVEKFNKFFFETVKFVLATEQRVDWTHKSTYIQLLVEQSLANETRVYKKNSINTITGYINTVKPYHTKISQVLDSYKGDIEEANINVEEIAKTNITAKFGLLDPAYTETLYDYWTWSDTNTFLSRTSGVTVTLPLNQTKIYTLASTGFKLGAADWSIMEVSIDGTVMNYPDDFYIQGQQLFFGLAPQADVIVKLDPTKTLTYDGGSFITTDSAYEETQEMGEFRQPENYNDIQLNTADLRPLELLNINVQTNRILDTYDNDTRTFAMIQDNNGNMITYDLVDSNTTITTLDLNTTDNVLEVLDINKFDNIGHALIGTEIVKYTTNNNQLILVARGLNNTFISNHTAGVSITNIGQNITQHGPSTIRLNEKGKSILDSDATFDGNRIINSGKGIAI